MSLSNASNPMRCAEAAGLIDHIKPGITLIYYTGCLARDRTDRYGNAPKTAPKVKALQEFMYTQGCPKDFEFGKEDTFDGEARGHLTQRRIAPEVYEYRFTKNMEKAA